MSKVVKDIDNNEITQSFYRSDSDYGFKGALTTHSPVYPHARYTIFWGLGLYRASYNINTGVASYTQLYANRNIIYTCAVRDTNNYLYFGTDGTGIHRMSMATSTSSTAWGITSGTVYDILLARNGNMYFATSEGFYFKIKGATNNLTQITLPATPQKLTQGLDGTIYICTNAGIYTMPETGTTVSTLYATRNWKYCVTGNDGTIWFATDYLIYKLRTGQSSITDTGFSNIINYLYAEKNSSRIWCCCNSGIYTANSGSTNFFSAFSNVEIFTAYEYDNYVYFGSVGKIIRLNYILSSRAFEEFQINDIPTYKVNAFDEDDNGNLLLIGTGVSIKEKEKYYSRINGKWVCIPNNCSLSKHITIDYSNEGNITLLDLDNYDRINIKFNYPDWSNINLSVSDFYKLPKISCKKEIRCLSLTDFSGSGTLNIYPPENLLELTKCGIIYKFYIESFPQYQSILPNKIFTIHLKFDFLTSDICNVYVSVPNYNHS